MDSKKEVFKAKTDALKHLDTNIVDGASKKVIHDLMTAINLLEAEILQLSKTNDRSGELRMMEMKCEGLRRELEQFKTYKKNMIKLLTETIKSLMGTAGDLKGILDEDAEKAKLDQMVDEVKDMVKKIAAS
jgi:hypothetical protein